jgi:hypothetical protein
MINKMYISKTKKDRTINQDIVKSTLDTLDLFKHKIIKRENSKNNLEKIERLFKMFDRYLNINHDECSTISFYGLKIFINWDVVQNELNPNDYIDDNIIADLANEISLARKNVLEKYKKNYPEIVEKFSKTL